MKTHILQDYQDLPNTSVYLTMIVKKVPKGSIPPMTICPVVRCNHVFIRLDSGTEVNPRRFFLANTRPISDYYMEGQYKFCIRDEHVCLEFSDPEPYNCYIEYAGKCFDSYLKQIGLF